MWIVRLALRRPYTVAVLCLGIALFGALSLARSRVDVLPSVDIPVVVVVWSYPGPNIAATPDGEQVWLTLKDVGKVMAIEAKPPFGVLRTIASGPITNHVNFARTAQGQLAYVTVGGLNEVQVHRTSDFERVATILRPVGTVASATHLRLRPIRGAGPPTTVALFDQGLTQVLQAAVAGLEPKRSYALVLASRADASGNLEPIARFTANPAGAAVVNAVGPIRQVVQPSEPAPRRYLAIAPVSEDGSIGRPVQVQVADGAERRARTPPGRASPPH